MTPRDFWEASDADTVVDGILLGKWFEPSDHIVEVTSVETAAIGHRERVGYRFRVHNESGDYMVEQQAYYESEGNQIGWLRVMCAGFVPVS
jgi:hypothetical protein